MLRYTESSLVDMPSLGNPVLDGFDTRPVILRQKNTNAGTSKGGKHGQPISDGGAQLHKVDKEAHGKKRVLSAQRRRALQAARLGMKMTQKEAAVAAGVKPRDYQAFESGKLMPTAAQLSRLQRALKTTI